MLVISIPSVNFINIIGAPFSPKPKRNWKKLPKRRLYEKFVRKKHWWNWHLDYNKQQCTWQNCSHHKYLYTMGIGKKRFFHQMVNFIVSLWYTFAEKWFIFLFFHFLPVLLRAISSTFYACTFFDWKCFVQLFSTYM